MELKCHVSGSPVEAVTWLKDGAEVRAEGRVSLRPRDTLRVAPVVASDAGMYQCAATHAHNYAHAHAHVTLGGKRKGMEGEGAAGRERRERGRKGGGGEGKGNGKELGGSKKGKERSC